MNEGMTVSEIIEEVREEICEKYCKFGQEAKERCMEAKQSLEGMALILKEDAIWDEIDEAQCKDCPISRL